MIRPRLFSCTTSVSVETDEAYVTKPRIGNSGRYPSCKSARSTFIVDGTQGINVRGDDLRYVVNLWREPRKVHQSPHSEASRVETGEGEYRRSHDELPFGHLAMGGDVQPGSNLHDVASRNAERLPAAIRCFSELC